MPYFLGLFAVPDGVCKMNRVLIFVVLQMFLTPLAVAESLKILLTNDDGYLSPGIQAMKAALIEAGHTVYLVAPSSNQSGSATSISSTGVRFSSLGEQVWRVEGRPADAVRLGIGHLLKEAPPDLVLSGINFGQNMGLDVMVSGTMGAAVTASQLGVPAIALSAEIDFAEAASGFASTLAVFPFAATYATRLIEQPELLAMPGVLVINFPKTLPFKGIKQARLAPSSLINNVYEEAEPGLWRSGYAGETQDPEDTDRKLLSTGYITVTHIWPTYAATNALAPGSLDWLIRVSAADPDS